jgi:ABC-type glycerol-3-phosphate transport system substrate-binding protein
MSYIKLCICLVVALPMVLSPAVAEIYSWVDENGELHYSDTPEEGAQQVEPGPTNTFSASPGAAATSSSAAADDDAEAAAYADFAISSPTQEQVLWNTGGVVPVTLALSPRLKNGHQIQLLLDGAQVMTGISLSYQLTSVERGAHSLQANIVDPAGKQLAAAQPVTFTVQQNSVLNPNNPNNRRLAR